MDKLVSVIVPVYNAEKYLEKCITSIANQTYKNIEIILINDGSQDDSQIICESMREQDTRIVLFSQENSGVSVARNLGLKKSKGELILFVDADDVICNDMIQCMVETLEKEKLDMVVSNNVEFNNLDDLIFEKNNSNALVRVKKENIDFYGKQTHSTVWGVLFKRRSINNTLFKTNIYVAEDSMFFVEVVLNISEIGYLDKCLYAYNRRPDSVTGRKNYDEKKFSEILAWETICRLTEAKCPNSLLSKSSHAVLGMSAYKGLKTMALQDDYNINLWNSCSNVMRKEVKSVIVSSLSIKTKLMYVLTCICPRLGVDLYNLIKQ